MATRGKALVKRAIEFTEDGTYVTTRKRISPTYKGLRQLIKSTPLFNVLDFFSFMDRVEKRMIHVNMTVTGTGLVFYHQIKMLRMRCMWAPTVLSDTPVQFPSLFRTQPVVSEDTVDWKIPDSCRTFFTTTLRSQSMALSAPSLISYHPTIGICTLPLPNMWTEGRLCNGPDVNMSMDRILTRYIGRLRSFQENAYNQDLARQDGTVENLFMVRVDNHEPIYPAGWEQMLNPATETAGWFQDVLREGGYLTGEAYD